MSDSPFKQVTISMPEPLLAQVRKEAYDARISVSQYVRMMHQHYKEQRDVTG